MVRQREEYDWLEDPFDERKCAEELKRARSRGMRGAGCALVAVVVAAVGLVVTFAVIVGALGADLAI